MAPDTCPAEHDWFTLLLSIGLILGLLFSYGPQHYRIINKGSSEGFSPWFLLLGSTSSASGMLNMITMQWGVLRCCAFWSFGTCLEQTLGVIQVSMQWALFAIILVLYMVYYPQHLRHASTDVDVPRPDGQTERVHVKTLIRSDTWRLSVILSWVVFIHIVLEILITLFLLLTSHRAAQIELWATFLGVSSALLAGIQYAPQLTHTYKAKTVGALSIPMMLIQSPGAAVMVLSIALRPGTNWTSWITFAVSGIMQAILLGMCLVWKARQRRLDIDDFGEPVKRGPEIRVDDYSDGGLEGGEARRAAVSEETPLLAER